MSEISASKRRIFTLIAVGLVTIITCALIETAVRVYQAVAGVTPPSIERLDDVLEKAWFAPHPYLVYTFKPSHSFTFVHPKYQRPTITTNRFGFRACCELDVSDKTKPPGVLRVATFGGSTTMGTNNDNEVWPYLTGRKLGERLPEKKIEVLNEGLMGYTSIDNLIDLSLRVTDFDCDVFVLYLGVNDYTAAAPPEIYRSDHAHYRKTLYQSIGYSVSEVLPRWLMKSRAVSTLLVACGVPDRRNLAACTGTAMFRDQEDFVGFGDDDVNELVTRDVVRNFASMIGVIRAHNPRALIVVSSFYDYRKRGYVHRLNPALRELSDKYEVTFVDLAARLPYDRRVTVDDVHFTPEGAELVSDVFSQAIAQALEGR